MLPRRILLADADAFYVAVARMVDPEGAGKAPLLIVGGSRESRGVVCSASYETRKFGVRSAMPISRALRLCPDALCVPVPRKACSVKSHEIREVLERFAPVVEGASIDEWYLDLGGTEGVYHNESLAATSHRIRDAVKRETDLSISIGGGTNKLVAKLAVERAKPKPGSGADGVHIVPPGQEAEFLRTFELADIPLIGPKFQERLGSLGMTMVTDVLQYDLATLTSWFGKREAEWLFERVRGINDSEVDSGGEAKSISRDETFPRDIDDDRELERELVALVTRAAFDLRSDGLAARTITVRLRDMDFRTRSARRTLAQPIVSDRILLKVSRELLAKLRNARRVPARLLGVAVSSLSQDPEADQIAMFASKSDSDAETHRDRVLAKAIDRVRARFGPKSMIPGTLAEKE
jgi:DNA polymerase-4